MIEHTEEPAAQALAWVASRLDDLDVPYQIAGGLAAIAHGASRALNDIDIYVPVEPWSACGGSWPSTSPGSPSAIADPTGTATSWW